MARNFILFLITMAIAFAGCKEPFSPPDVRAPGPYLVVEGVLNAGSGATNIHITRTAPLDINVPITGENGAAVIVEGRDNLVVQLDNSGNGIYSSPNLGLTIGNEYRLRIITANGREYLSDYVVARQSPPIDSIGFVQVPNGVQLYVNSHDPTNATRYYRWDYDETWEIRTFYTSRYRYIGDATIVPRTINEDVSTCWKYNSSSAIILGSSARLHNDVINQAPLYFFFNGDERLAVRYSILLRQHALDKKAYEFFELMKRNTENLGTVFDPQPTEITGNITCITDIQEPVIGYITAATISEKRVFIRNSQLTSWRFSEYCPSVTIKNDPDSINAAYGGNSSMPYDAVIVNGYDTTHWLGSGAACVDCTYRGGSLAKPSYW